MRANELRMMGEDELAAKEQELRKTLFNIGIQKATGQLNNTALVKKTKKELARVLSVIRENQLKGKK